MSKPPCHGTRKDGAACRAPALPGSTLCWSHDPRQAEVAAQARAAGAAKGGRLRALAARRSRLDTPRQLMAFIAALAHDTLSGRVAPDVSRAVAYALSLQLRLLEASELEQRIAALEQRAATRRSEAGRWGA